MGAMDLSFSEINGASSLLSVEPTTANHVPINLGNSALLYSTLRNSVENNQGKDIRLSVLFDTMKACNQFDITS